MLSVRSARATFPELSNFRVGTLRGWRRVFAHTTSIFHVRGVARGREAASLSIEECCDVSSSSPPSPPPLLVVSLFEVPFSEEAAAALLEREHEFRFVSVKPLCRRGIEEEPHSAVACAAWNDTEYRRLRIRDDEDWKKRYSGVSALSGEPFRIARVWEEEEDGEDGGQERDKTNDDQKMILPCRAYLRHVVLAARSLGEDAERCVLDNTFLADRRTTVREHLERDPSVMLELPPKGLASRYGG